MVAQAIRASMHFLVEHYFVLWDAFEPDSDPVGRSSFSHFSEGKAARGSWWLTEVQKAARVRLGFRLRPVCLRSLYHLGFIFV